MSDKPTVYSTQEELDRDFGEGTFRMPERTPPLVLSSPKEWIEQPSAKQLEYLDDMRANPNPTREQFEALWQKWSSSGLNIESLIVLGGKLGYLR